MRVSDGEGSDLLTIAPLLRDEVALQFATGAKADDGIVASRRARVPRLIVYP